MATGRGVRLPGRARRRPAELGGRGTTWSRGRGLPADGWDLLTSSDPGLLRLRLGLRALVALGLAVTTGWALSHAFGGVTIVAMLLSGIVAMNGAFASSGRAPRDAAVTVAWLPVLAAPAVLAAALLAHHHRATLVGFVVAMVAAVFVRRFGSRAFIWGMSGFFLYFFTVFTRVPPAQVPQTLAVVAAASACVVATATVLVPDRPDRLVAAALRSCRLRLTALLEAARDAVAGDLPADRVDRVLHGRSFRVLEGVLILEGYLAQVDPGTGARAAALRHGLLDGELAAEELGSAAAALATATDVPPAARTALVTGLDAAVRRDRGAVTAAADELDAVTAGCREPGPRASPGAGGDGCPAEETSRALTDAAGALRHLAEALADTTPVVPDHLGVYEAAVPLLLGNLPGTVPSVTGLIGVGTSRAARVSMNTRLCVQTAIAATLAVVAGEAVSDTRYYWAVLACFLTLTGTFTSGEIVVKGASRVAGTVAGLVVATLAVDVTGEHDAAIIAVMAVCVFLGLYFFRVSYVVMAFAITTIMGELYNVLREFSDSLLLLRVAETAIGAAIAIAVGLLVLPLRTADARAAAVRAFVADLRVLLLDVRDRAAHPGATSDLFLDSRHLDARLHQLALVARPAAGATLLGLHGRRATEALLTYTRTAYRARRLVVAVAGLVPGTSPELARGCDALVAALDGRPGAALADPLAGPAVTPGSDVGRVLGDLTAVAARLPTPGSPLRRPPAGRHRD